MPHDDPELRRFEALKPLYNAAFSEFDEDRRFLDGSFANQLIPDQWQEQGFEPTVMPTGYDAVENAADHIMATPNIRVPLRPTVKDREQERDVMAHKQAFLSMWWDTVDVQCGAPLRAAKKSLIRGRMVLKKEIDWDAIPALPENPDRVARQRYRRQLERASRSRFIWKLSCLPRETVYEDPTRPWDPRYVYESYRIKADDAHEMFGDSEIAPGTKLSDFLDKYDPLAELEYVEYWSKPSGNDPGKYICWIEQHRVHEAENPYSWQREDGSYEGYVPYVIEDPGWGEIDSKMRPEDRCVSLIRPLRQMLKAETRQLTEVEYWLRLYMWRPVIGKNLPTDKEGNVTLEMYPGAIWNLNQQQEVDVLQFGDVPLGAMQFLQKVQSTADRSTKFGALGGIAQSGVSTATESDQLFRNAATKISGPIEAMRRAVIRVNSWILQDIEKVLEVPVTLYGSTDVGPSEVTLKPTDITGFYQTSVQMDTSDREDHDRVRARLAADLYRSFPGLSERTAMGMAGVKNPTDEQDERWVEDLMRSEPMVQVGMMLALSGMGQQAELVRDAFARRLTEEQEPAGGGAGDAEMLTSVDDQGNPAASTITQARQDFVMDNPGTYR